jgi:hypothetical protein
MTLTRKKKQCKPTLLLIRLSNMCKSWGRTQIQIRISIKRESRIRIGFKTKPIHNTADEPQKLRSKLVENGLLFVFLCGPDLNGQTGTVPVCGSIKMHTYQKKKDTTLGPKVWNLSDNSECSTNVPLYCPNP